MKFTGFSLRLAIFVLLWLFVMPLFFSSVSSVFHLKDYAVANFTFYVIPLAFMLVLYFKWRELDDFSYKQSFFETLVFACVAAQFVLLYLNLTVVAKFLYSNYGIAWEWVHLLLVYGTTALMELCVFLAVFNSAFVKKFKKYSLVFLAIVVTYCVLLYVLSIYWAFFSYAVVSLVAVLLKLVFGNAGMLIQGDTVGLFAEKFVVGVGPTCAGIESILLFTLLYVIFVVYRLKNVSFNKTAEYFVLGVFGAFALNVVRVFLIMVIGTQNPEFAIASFHDNAEWILFVFYFIIYMYIILPHLKKKEN